MAMSAWPSASGILPVRSAKFCIICPSARRSALLLLAVGVPARLVLRSLPSLGALLHGCLRGCTMSSAAPICCLPALALLPRLLAVAARVRLGLLELVQHPFKLIQLLLRLIHPACLGRVLHLLRQLVEIAAGSACGSDGSNGISVPSRRAFSAKRLQVALDFAPQRVGLAFRCRSCRPSARSACSASRAACTALRGPGDSVILELQAPMTTAAPAHRRCRLSRGAAAGECVAVLLSARIDRRCCCRTRPALPLSACRSDAACPWSPADVRLSRLRMSMMARASAFLNAALRQGEATPRRWWRFWPGASLATKHGDRPAGRPRGWPSDLAQRRHAPAWATRPAAGSSRSPAARRGGRFSRSSAC